MSKVFCSCYKSIKEKDIQCPFKARPGELYCGKHKNCNVIFGTPPIKSHEIIEPHELIKQRDVIEINDPIIPTLINVRQAFLTQRGFKDYTDWENQPKSLYIGRTMRIGSKNGPIVIKQSKWKNPFKLNKNKDNIDEILDKYEAHVRTSSLYNDLNELSGKELGCWCKGMNPCHGDVLIQMFKEKFNL